MKLDKEYSARGLHIIGVSLDRDAGKLESTLRENEIQCPVIFQGDTWDGPISRAYGVHSIPNRLLLNRDGMVVDEHSGFDETIEELLRK